jgi:hypothetical protein
MSRADSRSPRVDTRVRLGAQRDERVEGTILTAGNANCGWNSRYRRKFWGVTSRFNTRIGAGGTTASGADSRLF